MAPVTINSMLAALNGLFHFLGWDECPVQVFAASKAWLFREELPGADPAGMYDRLLETARSLGRERLALVMETLCATGIRVSEVCYITVEGGPGRTGGNFPQGEDTHHPIAPKAVPEAAEVRP